MVLVWCYIFFLVHKNLISLWLKKHSKEQPHEPVNVTAKKVRMSLMLSKAHTPTFKKSKFKKK